MSDPLLSRAQAKRLVKNKTMVVGYPGKNKNEQARIKFGARCGLRKRNSKGRWVPWTDGYAYLGLHVNGRARRAIHMCMYAHGHADTLQDAANDLSTQIHVARIKHYKKKNYFN